MKNVLLFTPPTTKRDPLNITVSFSGFAEVHSTPVKKDKPAQGELCILSSCRMLKDGKQKTGCVE